MVNGAPTVRDRVRGGVAGLHPGVFALVMATGILSTAARELGLPWIPTILLAVAAAAYLVLCALTCWRLLAFPGRVVSDAAAAERAFGFFTFVAGSNVLGLGLASVGLVTAAEVLAAVGAAAWLLLTYAIPFALITAPRTLPITAVNGSWLIWVVGTQSVASAAATFAALYPAHGGALAFVAIVLWGVAFVLYVILMAIILQRLLLGAVPAEQLTPPYWITMGATAITVFAAARILAVPTHSFVPVEAFRLLTLIIWAFGSWWWPLLILLGVWRHVVRRVPLSYEPTLWSMVFPLGMYAASSEAFGAVAGIAPLDLVARGEVWLGLVAWVAVAGGMLVAGWRALR